MPHPKVFSNVDAMYDAWGAKEHSLALEPSEGEVKPEARGVP